MEVLEFRILGPLEVIADDVSVPLGGRHQRALLTLLLLRANEPATAKTGIINQYRDANIAKPSAVL